MSLEVNPQSLQKPRSFDFPELQIALKPVLVWEDSENKLFH